MNLKQLETFVKVADLRSFSRAADALFLTQPTVSAHIFALEKRLQTRLFVRNTKTVCLSEKGQRLYQYAKQIIEIETNIEQEFLGKEERSRCITIAASTIPAQYILPGILAVFNEKYPKEQVQLVETDSAKVIDMVVNYQVEIGFTGTILDKKYCKYFPFYEDELVIIAPNTEKYQKLVRDSHLAAWLTMDNFILREEGSGTRKETEQQLKELGINMHELNVVASVENPETIKRSVTSGMGISIISHLAVEEEVKLGKMIRIPLGEHGTKRTLNLVYNKNYQLSGSATKFAKVVKQMYKI